MRIFRTLMLLTGVGVFMPSPPEDSTAGNSTAQASTPTLLSSATEAIADAVGFCGRQPTVCQTAGYVAGRLEAKAKYSVKLIYEWANDSSTGRPASPLGDAAAGDPLKTGAIDPAPVRLAGGQSTLTIEDLIPEWRGPQPRPKG